MKRAVAVGLVASLLASGCAGATRQVRTAPPGDLTLLAGYVQRLPVGSRVRVRLAGGGSVAGSLMKADDRAIVIQPHTRLPEPPVELTLDRIAAVELDAPGGNPGRTAGIAIAAGVGGALAFFLILAAIYAGN
jgi:hypothetical protein